jgi:hypothetical protein
MAAAEQSKQYNDDIKVLVFSSVLPRLAVKNCGQNEGSKTAEYVEIRAVAHSV